ncbi:MAG: hypothetical protein ACK5TN_09120 [Acidobacteriota bacterium]|jgi:hypothetical protein
MPNRLVRAEILTSGAVNSLSIEGELAYRRLMSVADDFGRFDGRAAVIRASAFPLRMEAFPLETIEQCLAEMAGAGLIDRYEVDGKPYLEILKFNQRTRAAVSKYPPPDRRMAVIRQSDDSQFDLTP